MAAGKIEIARYSFLSKQIVCGQRRGFLNHLFSHLYNTNEGEKESFVKSVPPQNALIRRVNLRSRPYT